MWVNQLHFFDKVLRTIKEINSWLAEVPVTGVYTGWLVLLLLIFVVLLTAWLSIRRRKRLRRATSAEELQEVFAEEISESIEEDAEINRENIVEFFLIVFRAQLGAPKDARVNFKPLDETGSGNGNTTYELQVFHDKQWVSRRMTVGLVGDDATSRSKCFHVIYDDHFIIKIPRNPITGFETYIAAIESDQKIVKKIAPRECIVPTVSAVLKLVHPFSDAKTLSPTQLEEKYLGWLRKYPSFQAYLKIGRTYAFVMDLSRFYFLGRIIDDIHSLPNKVFQEIVGYPDVIWENHGFEGRYAIENDEGVEAVRNVFKVFEERSHFLLRKAGRDKTARFILQKWFLIHLAGRELAPGEKDLTPELIAGINALLQDIFAENREVIDAYRRTIRGCVQTVTVSQNRRQIAGLVSNVLDLLAWLRDRGVAMRDLKPDNLLVAGDYKHYPQFLDAVDAYSVGLIDVETAASYQPDDLRIAMQPPLGGTPSYATPSHLIANEALAACFPNAARILYLQDWYAGVAIVYELITGERLFDQTGKLILGIKTSIFKNVNDAAAQLELFKNASRMFWHSARSEITGKARDKGSILKSVMVPLGDANRSMIRAELKTERQAIRDGIKGTVAAQNVFTNGKIRQGLIAAPRQKITRLKAKWLREHKKDDPGLRFLDTLEALKVSAERNLRLSKAFDHPRLTPSADDLLFLMFGIVRQAMYRPDWGALVPTEVTGVRDGKGTTTV